MTYDAKTKSRTETKYIVVHCADSKPSMDIGAAEIDRWHRARGWACIGYNRVIKRDGTIEQGRPDDQIGAHVEGYNSVSIGICLVGGLKQDGSGPENNFTVAQMNSLKVLLVELRKRYPKAIILGHYEFPGVKKTCPNFPASKWAKDAGL
ncbi:amidase [Ralstonia phage BOESR1]|uniref:Amidase n=1 Tax=Ralstonia phage BOESR1 TaxID=3034917 RepID=A0AA50IHB8_9CAUD|nr:amidase [Ralstonia phage BOESR1]WLW40588.1 amidase [Ralstonia phage BOESR1]